MEEDEVYTPKNHLMLHLLRGLRYYGNPNVYSTWFDESLNKTLKARCRETSQATFEASVLYRMRELLGIKK